MNKLLSKVSRKAQKAAIREFGVLGYGLFVTWAMMVHCPECLQANSTLLPREPIANLSVGSGACEAVIEVWRCKWCGTRFMTELLIELDDEEPRPEQLELLI